MKKSFGSILLLAFCLLLTGCSGVGEKSASISSIYLVAAVISAIVLVIYLFLPRQKDKWHIALFTSVVIINSGYYWLSVSSTIESALNANRVSYLGSVFLPFVMLMIILNVTKLNYKKWIPWLLFSLGIVVFLIAASPGILDIYYKDVTLDTTSGVTKLDKDYGPLHALYLFYLLGYFIATVATIAISSVKKTIESKAHAIIIAIAVFVNIGVWYAEQMVNIEFEVLSISYIISELFLLALRLMIQENEKRMLLVNDKKRVTPAHKAQKSSDAEIELIKEAYINGLPTLTRAENTIYQLHLAQKSTKEILAELNITENTLKYHNKNIYSKLGVSSRKQLLEVAESLDNETKE